MSTNSRPSISVEDAIDIIIRSTAHLEPETVSLVDAGGRILAEDIVAGADIPAFDNSAMDGYAVRAADITGATRERPARLAIRGEVRAGGDLLRLDDPESAVRIMTGAPIPPGADTVVMVEDTAETDGAVSIYDAVPMGSNIRRAGEDIPRGAVTLTAGERLRASEIGVLASLNASTVRVARRPRVAIISTGDEVIEVGAPARDGVVRNSNAYILREEVRRTGGEPTYLGIAPDTLEATRDLLVRASEHDVIITSGGVSMGRYDFVRDALASIGFDISIESILMKPGKPCVFGRRDSTLFFGLPGNPVSTQVAFLQFVRPALLALMGARKRDKPLVRAILEEPIDKKPGRVHFIRGVFTIENGEFRVRTTGPQGSGILRSMSRANCLIILPADMRRAERGDRVTIQLIDHDEV